MAILRLALPALLASGCASGLSYTECSTNDDCTGRATDAGRLYCSSDHFCVLGLPDEQLCDDKQTIGTDGPGALTIGVLTDFADPNDQALSNAIRLAVDEINKHQSGYSQPPLVVHFCSTSKDADQALRSARRAVEFYHAAALLGPTTSDEVVNIASYARDSGTLVVTPSATSSELTTIDDGVVWRTCPSDSLQGVQLAGLVHASAIATGGMPKIASLYSSSIYGTGLNKTFVTEYEKLVPATVPVQIPFAKTSDLPDSVSALGKEAPTQAVLIADLDAPALVAMLQHPGLETTQFFMTDSAKGPGLYGPMGSMDAGILKRIHGTAPSNPAGTAFDTFSQLYLHQFNVSPGSISFVANAYDAAYVVAIAAAATVDHVPTGKELAANMGRFKNTGEVLTCPSDYLKAVKSMASGQVVRVAGVSGPMEFDAHGDLTTASYDCWSIDTMNGPPMIVSPKCP